MTTVLESIDKGTLEAFHDIWAGMFLHGECYAFAIALSRGTGWPMVGLMRDNKIDHAGVRRPDGMIQDIRGAISEQDFARPFPVSPLHLLLPVTEDELRTVAPVHEMMIATASRIAQALWPDIPWKEDTLQSRVIAFADALEKLSRDHGFWIRGATPGSSPMIALSGDDEGGYELQPTGLGYTINRYLDSHHADEP